MRWRTDRRHTNGGYWRCPVKLAAEHARYNSSKRGRDRWRRFNKSEKGRAVTARYEATPHRKLGKQLNELTRVRVSY